MPTVHGSSMEESLATLRFEVRVMADAGTELQSVIVRDRWGMPIGFEPTVEPCASNFYEGTAAGIARNRLPLNVEVAQCDGSRFGPDENPELGALPHFTDDEDALPVPCSDLIGIPNPACDEVVAEARRARATLSMLCREVADLRREYREFLAIAALSAAVFVLAFAAGMTAIGAGGWIGAIIGAVLLAVALAAAIAAGWATDQALKRRRALNDLEPRLRGKRAEFEEYLRRMYARCCPDGYLLLEEREMPC